MSSQLLPPTQSSSILALSADTTKVTAALIEPVAGSHRLIAWESTFLSDTSGASHPIALRGASQNLGLRLGRSLWDDNQDAPHMHSPDPALNLGLGHVVAAVDPLPPLRVWVGGLTGHESLAAAQAALDSTVCRTVAVYRFGMGDAPNRLAEDFTNIRPDLAVIVGGYDRPGSRASRAVLALSQEVAQALEKVPQSHRPALYFAGNRWLAGTVLEMYAHLPGGLAADAVENVTPGPGVRRTTSLSVAASRLYWRRCRATPALQSIARWITPPSEVRSLSWSFAQTVRLWRQIHNLPALHGLFCADHLWIHACALGGEEGVRLRIAQPNTRSPAMAGWPPLRLVSGPWPEAIWPRQPGHWWDPTGLSPTVANVGQIDPLIAYEVLAHDLLHEG